MRIALSRLLALGIVGLSLTVSARADMVTYSFTVPETSVPFSTTQPLQLFNTNLGTLTGVTITIDTSATASIVVYNFSGASQTFTNASADIPVEGTGPAGANLTAEPTAYLASGTIGSGVGPYTYSGLTSTASSSVMVPSGSFAAYEGPGTFFADFTLAAPTGTFSGSSAPGVAFTGIAKAGGTLSVTYSYNSVPEPASMTILASGLVLGGISRFRKGRRTISAV